ncbi:dienelactone hydrolase family protein [Urechidicola vernalis]|uniref:Dienelactone hydrolase family protein n=1 Tax=Urechidicola vernalis TaxID=3075600 RepID=A0ABU2Y6I8_9FLAO|nr:dienelactone hydrolase family protein [Urechidicola sp. P050]MDT0553820.1 dienelactone hydrolase family protein [Urechidicola sp. P050]
MKNLLYCLAFFSLIFVISCSSDDDTPPKEPRTAADVREDFSNLIINDGVNDLALESLVEGVFWNFRIVQPESASSANKRPLIIDLHGGARNMLLDAHKTTSCLILPGMENLDPYIVRPNSSGYQWYDEFNQVQVQALVDMVSQFLDVDTSKIVVMGYSDGGNGSFFFAQFFPEIFSAAIPLASSYDTSSSGGYTKFDIPIYAFHGEEDELFDVEITQGFIDGSINAGSDITFVRVAGLDHFAGCEYETYMPDVEDWLLNHVWN